MRCCAGDEGFVALRSRPAEGGFKPPHAALAEDRRGERCGKGAREASGGDLRRRPLLKCRNVVRWRQNPGESAVSGDEPGGSPPTGQAASGVKAA